MINFNYPKNTIILSRHVIRLLTKEQNGRRCIICGCTEHRFVGCIVHWLNHKKKKNGRCE